MQTLNYFQHLLKGVQILYFNTLPHPEEKQKYKNKNDRLAFAGSVSKVMFLMSDVSRLTEDVNEKTERYETAVLERDTYQKEVDCLKHQNTDDLYLPQIKEVMHSGVIQSAVDISNFDILQYRTNSMYWDR